MLVVAFCIIKGGWWYYHLSPNEVTSCSASPHQAVPFISQGGFWLVHSSLLSSKKSWFISTLMNNANKNLHINSLALLTGPWPEKNYDWGNVHSKILLDIYQCFLPLIKERTQKKIWLRHTSYGLAQLKTKGILGEIPCLHSAKCHLWLQVRGKKIQPSCVFGSDRSGMKY